MLKLGLFAGLGIGGLYAIKSNLKLSETDKEKRIIDKNSKTKNTKRQQKISDLSVGRKKRVVKNVKLTKQQKNIVFHIHRKKPTYDNYTTKRKERITAAMYVKYLGWKINGKGQYVNTA